MKKIFTLFAALAMVMSMSAEMVYLQPSNNWLEGNAEFWVHSWGGTAGVSGKLENLGLGLYGLDINDNTSCLFVRQESGQSSINWDNNWYKTGDQTIATDKRCYKVINWHEDGTGWVATPSLSGYIAGDGALLGEDWNPEAEANKMTKQEDGTYTLVKTVTLEAKTYGYKVTNGSWDWSLGNGGENATLTIETEGKYSVTFTYTPASEQVTAVATLVTHTVTLLNDAGAELEGAGQYEDGAFVTVSAPEEWDGYIFVSWVDEEGNGVSDNASTDIQVLEDITLTALYAMMMPLEVTDLEIVMDPVVGLMGSTELAGGTLSLQLVVDASAEGEDGEFPLTEDSQIWLGDEDTQFEFLEGIALIDMENNAARAFVLAADDWGMIYYFDIEMSAAAPAEPTEVVVENAIITVEEQSDGMGGTYESVYVTAEWNGTLLKLEGIEKNFEGFLQITQIVDEATDDWYIWMAMNGTVTTVDNVLTVSGEFTNNFTGDVYNVTISGTLPAEEPDYFEIEDDITDLIFNGEMLAFMGGPSANFRVELFLVLTGETQDDQWPLNLENSSISIMGQDVTIIDGYLYDVEVTNPDAPAAKALLHVESEGQLYEVKLNMTSAAPQEAIVIEVEDANCVVEPYSTTGMGEPNAKMLTLTADWTNPADDVVYTVIVKVKEFKEDAAGDDHEIEFEIGTMDNFLGFGEGVAAVIVNEGVVSIEADVTAWNGTAFELYISGKLPAEEPEVPTALDNVNTTVAPVKTIVNGQLVILKDGVQYNAQGAVVK